MNKVNVRSIFKSNEIYLIIIVIIISTIIGSINRSFLSIENLFDLLRSGSIIGVMSIGFLIVLISGGIDVSFAAVATVSMYVTVSILNKFGGNIYVALIISSVLGIALGAINASFISYFQIPTLIATLGTMNIFHASLLVIGKTAHISKIPEAIVDFGKGMIVSWTNSDGKTIGLSFLSFVMIVIFFLTWLILKYTMLGRGIYAIGGNFDAAKRLGLNVGKIQLFIYCYMGFVAGIAGLLNVSLVRYVNSFDLVGTEITVIAAVALGGAAIAG
ncbi:MAG: ABC transporter permease, partial [Actinobacteria bacterium]|nr:ABC transporter permease [Actinomycetota bacterium]